MNPYNPNPVTPINEPIYCSTCTIHPPNKSPCVNSVQKIPAGCKTIHIHGMPKNTTELVIKDIFKRFGNITDVRMKTAYWIVSFWMQDSVDAALALSGCRVSIRNSQDIDDTGQISIDCSKAGNGYEWKMVKKKKKVNAASDSKQTKLSVPLSGMHHNEEALDIAIKNNTVLNKDENSAAIEGEDDVNKKDKDDMPEVEKENGTLKSPTENHESAMEIRVNKKQLGDSIRKWRNLFVKRSQDINLKLAEVEVKIEKQNAIIGYLERESSEQKKKLTTLQQEYNDLVKQGDVTSRKPTRKSCKGARKQLIELQMEDKDKLDAVWNDEVGFHGKKPAARNADSASQPAETFDMKEAKLIGILSTFLLIHPFGVGLDNISEYVRRLDGSVGQAELHSLLKKCRGVFKFELAKGWTLNTFYAGDQPISTSQSPENQSAENTPHIPQSTSKLPQKDDVEVVSDTSVEGVEKQLSKWRERRRLQFIMEHFKEGWSAGFERRIQEFRKSDHPWGAKRRKHLRISENALWKFTIPSITTDRLKWLKENVPIPDKYEEEYILEERGLLPNVCDEEDTKMSSDMEIVGPGEMADKSLLPVYDCKRTKGKSRSSSNRSSLEAPFEEHEKSVEQLDDKKAQLSQIPEKNASEKFTRTEQPKDENPGMAAISKPILHYLNEVPDSPRLEIDTSDGEDDVPDAKDSATRPSGISDGTRGKHTKDPASTGNQRLKLDSENSCHSKNDVSSADNKVADPSVLNVLVKTALADAKSVNTKAETIGEPSISVKSLISDDPLRSQGENSSEAKTFKNYVVQKEDIWKREKKTSILESENVKGDEKTIRENSVPPPSSGGVKKNETSEIQGGVRISAKSKFSSLEEEHRLARILTRFNNSHNWSPELRKRLQQFVPHYCAKAPFRLSMTSSIGTIIEVSYFPLTAKQMVSLAGVDIPQKYPEEYVMEKEAAKNRDNSEAWLFTPEGRTRLSRIKISNNWKLWSPELRKALETLRPVNLLTNYKTRLFKPDGTFKRITLPAVTPEELKKINEVVVPEKLLEEYIDEMSGGSDDSFIREENNAPSANSHQMPLDVPIDHESVMKDIENTIDEVQKFLNESREKSKAVKSGYHLDKFNETGNAENVEANVDSQETKKRKVIDNEDDSKISTKRKLDHDAVRLGEIKTVEEPTNKEEIGNLTNLDKITSDRKEIKNVTETSTVANPIESVTRKISSKRKSNYDERSSVENRDSKAPRFETHSTKDNQTACEFTKEAYTSTPTKEETNVEGSKNPTANSVSLKNAFDKNITEPSAILGPKKNASDKISVDKNMTLPSVIVGSEKNASDKISVAKNMTEPSAIAPNKTSRRKSDHDRKQKAAKENKKICEPTKKVANSDKIKKESKKESEPLGPKVQEKTTTNKTSSKKKSVRREKESKDHKIPKAEKPNSDTSKEKKSDQISECFKSHAQNGSDGYMTEPPTMFAPEKTAVKIDSFKRKSDYQDKNPVENRDTKLPQVAKSNLHNATACGSKNKGKKGTHQLTKEHSDELLSKIVEKMKATRKLSSDSNKLELSSNKNEELLGRKADGNLTNPPNSANKTAVKRKLDHHDRIPAYNKEPIYAEKKVTLIREETIVAPCIIPLERQSETDYQGRPNDPRLNHNNRKSNTPQFLTVPTWNILPVGDLEMNTHDKRVTSASCRDCIGDGAACKTQLPVSSSSRDKITPDNVEEPPKKLLKQVNKKSPTGETKSSSGSFRSKNSLKGKGLDRNGEKKSSSGKKSNQLDRKSIENKVTKKTNFERFKKTGDAAIKETICTTASKNVVETGATISIPVQIQIDSHNLEDKNKLLGQEVKSKILSKDDTKTCEQTVRKTICTPASEKIAEVGATVSIPVQIQGDSHNSKDKNEVETERLPETCEPALQEAICTPASEKFVETVATISIFPVQLQGDSHNPKGKTESSCQDVDSDVLGSAAISVTIKVEPEDNQGSEITTNLDGGSGAYVDPLEIKDEPVDEKNSSDLGENTGKITITAEDVLSSVHNESGDDVSESTRVLATIPKSPADKEPSDGIDNKADDTVTNKDTKKRKSIDERSEERRCAERSNKHAYTYQINENKSDESKQTDAVLRSDGQSVANQTPEYSKELEMLFKVFEHSNLRRLNQITRNDSESSTDGNTSQNDCVVHGPENDPAVPRNNLEIIARNTADSKEALNTIEGDEAVEKCAIKQEPTAFVEPSVDELRVKQEPPEPEEPIQSSATLIELSENTQLIRNELDDLLGDSPDKELCDTYWSSRDLQRLAGNFA